MNHMGLSRGPDEIVLQYNFDEQTGKMVYISL
jgi:hypothetical protein